jgi:hypothetical protein
MALLLPKIVWAGGAGGTWLAQDPVLDDTRDTAVYDRVGQQAFTGRFKGLDLARRYVRVVRLGFLPGWKTWKVDEGLSHVGEAIERLFDDGWASFSYFPDASGVADGIYALDEKTRKTFPRNRLSPGNPVYSLELGMLRIG